LFVIISFGFGQEIDSILYIQNIWPDEPNLSALRRFKRFCSAGRYQKVSIVTTHWDQVDENDPDMQALCVEREKKCFGAFLKAGAQLLRHNRTPESALGILFGCLTGIDFRAMMAVFDNIEWDSGHSPIVELSTLAANHHHAAQYMMKDILKEMARREELKLKSERSNWEKQTEIEKQRLLKERPREMDEMERRFAEERGKWELEVKEEKLQLLAEKLREKEMMTLRLMAEQTKLRECSDQRRILEDNLQEKDIAIELRLVEEERKWEGLLTRREMEIQDLKEEKDALEKTVECLRDRLRMVKPSDGLSFLSP
jgi:hypothetical protein